MCQFVYADETSSTQDQISICSSFSFTKVYNFTTVELWLYDKLWYYESLRILIEQAFFFNL